MSSLPESPRSDVTGLCECCNLLLYQPSESARFCHASPRPNGIVDKLEQHAMRGLGAKVGRA